MFACAPNRSRERGKSRFDAGRRGGGRFPPRISPIDSDWSILTIPHQLTIPPLAGAHADTRVIFPSFHSGRPCAVCYCTREYRDAGKNGCKSSIEQILKPYFEGVGREGVNVLCMCVVDSVAMGHFSSRIVMSTAEVFAVSPTYVCENLECSICNYHLVGSYVCRRSAP